MKVRLFNPVFLFVGMIMCLPALASDQVKEAQPETQPVAASTEKTDDVAKAAGEGVEGKADAATVPAEEPPSERELHVMGLFNQFWDAIKSDRLDVAYNMHCDAFKKEVSLGDFFREKRAKISSLKLREVTFHTDECAEVAYFYSLTSGPMDLKNVPARQIWFVENGEWHLFEKKKERNLGGMGMSRSKVKPPCGYEPTPNAKAKSKVKM